MGLRKYALAGLSGILIVLCFPGINLSYLAWIALVPLLVSVYDANWKQSLKLGLVAGVIYFGGILNWIMVLRPFSTLFWVTLGFVVLTLYLSTYIFVFTVSVNFITRCWILDAGCWMLDTPRFNRGYRRPASSVERLASLWKRLASFFSKSLAYSFLVAVVWTGLEILRGRVATGLPWAGLGHTQWANLPIIQISSLTGMYGVTFLVALVNGTIASFLMDIRGWRTWLKSAAVPFALLILSLVYGWATLSGSSQGEKIKVALIPGNIDQMEKLMSWSNSEWIFDKYARITERAATQRPDIIVWPETSVPQYTFLSGTTPGGLRSLVQRWDAYFLIGTPHIERYPEQKTYNAAFLLSPAGEEIDRYYKIHLVPVSEYFPLKRYLPASWQRLVTGVSDWDMGDRYTVFSAPLRGRTPPYSPGICGAEPHTARFGVVICFESVFPELFRKFAAKGVNLMGIITNDSWFRGTYAPEQHYSMAPFRAVENRVAVFRCANYGISCIIDPWGRISYRIDPDDPCARGDESYLIGELCLRSGGTFYTRHGDYLPWACLAMTVFLAFQTWWYIEDPRLKTQDRIPVS